MPMDRRCCCCCEKEQLCVCVGGSRVCMWVCIGISFFKKLICNATFVLLPPYIQYTHTPLCEKGPQLLNICRLCVVPSVSASCSYICDGINIARIPCCFVSFLGVFFVSVGSVQKRVEEARVSWLIQLFFASHIDSKCPSPHHYVREATLLGVCIIDRIDKWMIVDRRLHCSTKNTEDVHRIFD